MNAFNILKMFSIFPVVWSGVIKFETLSLAKMLFTFGTPTMCFRTPVTWAVCYNFFCTQIQHIFCLQIGKESVFHEMSCVGVWVGVILD